VAGALVVLALTSASASAAETDLGPIGLGTIVVDNAREHVLVSGPAGNVVDVLDYSGHLVATIPGITGAYGMAIHGASLYVAESATGSVAQINLKTLTPNKRPFATGLSDPKWLAAAGGAVWVTTRWKESAWGTLASVNLATRTVKMFEELHFEPDLATTPARPGTLFLAEDVVSPGSIYRLNVTSGTPVVAAQATGLHQENIEGLVISPDGARAIPAAGSPYDFEELSAFTLKPDGVIYPGSPYPHAVAVSGRRANLLASGLCDEEPDIAVYPIGTTTATFTASTPVVGQNRCVATHGLALSADGRTLFAAFFSEPLGGDTVISAFKLP